MQMHESKTNTSSRNISSVPNLKLNNSDLPNNRVTSSASNDNNNNNEPNSNTNHIRRGGKKIVRDKQTANDDANSASVMSNLSSYSLIDDDHIDDQETINVGNLIIDLESDLEKEKIEHEQANNTSESGSKCTFSINPNNAPSSTSSSSSVTTKSMTSHKFGSVNETKPSTNKSNQKSNVKHANSTNNTVSNSGNITTQASNNGHASPRTIFKSSADEKGELKMKITRETKSGKIEHKASANLKSSTNSNAISLHQSKSVGCEDESIDHPDPSQSTSISSTRECGTSTSVGTITEPDCLGPCEPGTSVTLEGIVWQETEGGILVVNVTWRGKTYVGALLDCTRHDWAPPRLCDSPASDIDLKTNKGVRSKRIVTRSNGIGAVDEKNLLQTTGKLRNGKGRRIPTANEPSPSSSRKQRDPSTNENAQSDTNSSQINTFSNDSESANVEDASNPQESISTSEILVDRAATDSPTLIGCNEPNCSKKYRNMNGLLYHQAHAHGTDHDSVNPQDENCSSSTRDNMDSNKTMKSQASLDNNNDTVSAEVAERLSPISHPSEKPQQNSNQHNSGLKRQRTPSPQLPSKINKLVSNANMNLMADGVSSQTADKTEKVSTKRSDSEHRQINSMGQSTSLSKNQDVDRNSPVPQTGRALDNHQNSSISSGHQISSKLNLANPKPNNQPSALTAPAEEGMKPSGTSTGPPPAPHQANCYFNPAFLANTFNPYALPPYFPRSIYDPMAPATSNAAFLTRFMNNMRVPPPPSDSPSRLLSPSVPKISPFPPFKIDGVPAPLTLPTSMGGPIPNISPHLTNPQHGPPPPPPLSNHGPPLSQGPGHPPPPPPSIPGVSPNLRMPSQSDSLLPPTSQPPFLPPTSLSSVFGLPGMPNPSGPLGPQMPNLVDEALAKQFPRRFN